MIVPNKCKLVVIVFFCIVKISFSQTQKVKLDKNVNISLPKEFTLMTDEEIAKRYPSYKRPICMYTNIDRVVDFGYNVTNNSWGSNLGLLQKFYRSSILNMFSNVNFIQDTIITLKKRSFIVFEFVSEMGEAEPANIATLKLGKVTADLLKKNFSTSIEGIITAENKNLPLNEINLLLVDNSKHIISRTHPSADGKYKFENISSETDYMIVQSLPNPGVKATINYITDPAKVSEYESSIRNPEGTVKESTLRGTTSKKENKPVDLASFNKPSIKKYSYLAYTLQEGEIYVFNFTCSERMKERYQPIANALFKTIRVSSSSNQHETKIITKKSKIKNSKLPNSNQK